MADQRDQETEAIIRASMKNNPQGQKAMARMKRKYAGSDARGVVRTPQFPGHYGQTIEEVRKIIRKQKKAKGFEFDIPAGQDTNEIDLSGEARIWLGFAMAQTVLADPPVAEFPTISLLINEEIVISQVNGQFFDASFMDDEYYFFPRPLSGQDTITLQTNAPAPIEALFFIAYYI